MIDPAESTGDGIELPGEIVAAPDDLVEPPGAASPDPDEGWVGLSGATSLDLAAAERVAARHGATVVLVAGNQNSGKTTLLVQLYAQFLARSFAGYQFAGSETLDAFDDRHYPSRIDSGNPYPETEHTTDTDMRFLHLRVADEAGVRQALLMTDLWGELFLDVSSGVPVPDRVPIAPRADKTMVVIDGEEIVDRTKREAAMRDARLLIGAFGSEGGIRLDAPLLVLLSKCDCLGPKDAGWYEGRLAGLVTFAQNQGFTQLDTLMVAARPPDGLGVTGLEALMKWLCKRSKPVPVVIPEPAVLSGRVFTTGRMGAA